MIRKRQLLWMLLLVAPPAFSQSTGTIATGQVVRSCNAVTASTAALPGTVGGCTALALLTSGGVLPNTYTFEVTGGTATFMGSVDGSSWTTLGSATNTTQTFGGAYRWLGCVPTSVSGSLNCNVSVTVGQGGGGGGGGGGGSVNGTPVTSPNFNNTTPAAPANGKNIGFQASGSSVSAYFEGDGDHTHCFRGDSVFDVCGTAVSINGAAAGPTLNLTATAPLTWSLSSGVGNIFITGTGSATDCLLGTAVFGACPGGTGADAISSLTAATAANTISNLNFPQVWNWSITSASGVGLNIGESAASTGAGSSLVKISQLTGTTAVALTVQSGSQTAGIPAFQVQNSTGAVSATIGSAGAIAGTGTFSNLTGGTGTTLCGGLCTSSGGGSLGFARLRGSDNSNNSAVASGGSAIIAAGGNTSTAPAAGLVNNVTELASPYICSGTCTLNTVMCATGALDTVTACATTPQSVALGISEGVSVTTVWVTSAGSTQVTVDNTAVVGHTLCTSTATAGAASDSGGTGPCTTGQQIGVVMAISGTATIPNSTGTIAATFSATAPKVALTVRGGGGGGTSGIGPGTVNQYAIYNGTNSIVSSPALTLLNGSTVSVPSALQVGSTTTNLFINNQTVSSSGTALSPVATMGGFGINTGAVPAIEVNGGPWFPSPYVSVNGTSPTVNLVNFGTTPAAPANGRTVTWQRDATGNTSAALVGDGSANCLSGQGVYVACGAGGGGSGTVGSATVGQYAVYTGTTTVGGSPNFSESGSVITLASGSQIRGSNGVLTPGASGTGSIGINAQGQVAISQNGTAYRPIIIPNVNGTAMGVGVNIINFNNTTPAAPTNGINVTWNTPGASSAGVSASIVGDGVATDCLIGTGVFAACPGGTGGAVGGTGTATHIPLWAGTSGTSTTLTDTPITYNSTTQNLSIASSTTPLQPTSGFGIGSYVLGRDSTCVVSGSTAGPSYTYMGVSDFGCIGDYFNFTHATTTGAGTTAAALIGGNVGSGQAMGAGLAVLTQATTGDGEVRAGHFQTVGSGGLASTQRGLLAVSHNDGSSGVALPLNEALVAQTGNFLNAGLSAAPTTTDYTVHVLAPRLGSPSVAGQLMTTHAGLKIESQTLGVEFQTGAHVFANLPACASTYEGSIAALTDSTTASGIITVGGGTIHVQAYCDGTNWRVSGGGAGGGTGGGGGTGAPNTMLCTTTTTIVFATNSGHATICKFTLPAVAHNYIVRCVYSFNTQIGITSTSDVDFGVDITQGPANLTYFRGTFMDPTGTVAQQQSVSNVQGTAGNGGVANSFNLMRVMNVSNSTTGDANQQGWAVAIDGVWPATATAQTLTFYAGSSLAGAGGNVLPGAYCRLD